jgi:NAD(P)-dependent dehydrogenase (short-subunit alcohol dehydrogenase family)
MLESFDLTGKVALVTGATRGLGRAMAEGLARAGSAVAVNGRTPEACESAAREISRDTGSETLAAPCHVADWDALPALVGAVMDRFGRIDVLINNAAINPVPKAIADMTEAYWDKLQAVNVKGPLRLSQLVAPRMAENGGGSIVHVITIGAYIGGPGLSAYTSGKAALRNLTKVMAQEWAGIGVRVNAIAPGSFMTDMMKGALELPGFQEGATELSFQKRIADPKEIAGAAIYLASDASSFVTGTSLVVAGGVS